MIIYLAGGISGNLKPLYTKIAKGLSQEDSMKLYLAEYYSRSYVLESGDISILESFYYIDKTIEKLIPTFDNFLLDSGAFTFMQNSKTAVDWDSYLERYAAFINKNDIDKFFELDIDSIVGYEKVLQYRERLESLTGKKVIPVWHKSRGIEEFRKMCDDYPYVALGGIAIKEIKKEEYKYFPCFIKEAHERGARIHGLGFTALNYLDKCHFDSVDSTSWTSGNRFGHIWKFTGKTMIKIDAPKGKKMANPRLLAINNFNEWVKFQKYAEIHL